MNLKNIKIVSVIARNCFFLLLLFLTHKVNAQVTGDYRTIGTATFGSTSNWQTYNGSSWVTASVAPYNQLSSTTQSTSGSTSTANVTLSAANTFVYVGQFVSGNNIVVGTTVAAISGTSLTLSQAPSASVASNTTLTFSWSYTTGTNTCTTNSTTTVTVPTTNGMVVGQYITGTNMPSNAAIASIVDGTTITISSAATASSTTTLTFYSASISATLVSTSNVITLSAANPNIAVGQYVSGSSIQPGSKVLAVSGTTITLSQKPSGSRTTNLSFGYFTIPNLYINHNVTLDNNVANTIGNIYVNNSAKYYSAGAASISPINATFSIGVSGYGVALTCGTLNIAANATIIETNIAAAQTNTVTLNGGDGSNVIFNNGTLDFTTKGSTATNITFATANLNSNANTAVSGSGSFAFNNITVYMGFTAGNVVDMQSVFSMATASTTQTLTLSFGTFKMSSASTITPIGSTATTLGATSQIGAVSAVSATWTAGTNTISCSTTGLAVGMPVSGTGIPLGSIVTAVNASTITINNSGLTGSGATINFSATSTNGFTLNNASAVVNTGGGSTTNPATHQLGGVITVNVGTFNWGSNTNPVALSLTSGGQLYLNGGIVNVYGGYNAVANGGYTCIAAGTLNIPAGGSVNTTNQINSNSFYVFGVAYNNTFIMTGGNLNIASRNSGFNANGDFYLGNTTGTTSLSGGTVSFSDASLLTFGTFGSKSFYNLSVNTGGGSGTTLQSIATNISVTNTLTVNNGNVFDIGTNTLTLASNGVAGLGTINTQNAGSSPFGSFTGPFTGTVNFNGGTQTIPAATYNNLTISNARSATAISGATTYASSKIVTCGSSSVSVITNGMTVSGTGITAGTTVASSNAAVNSVAASWTGTTTVTCNVSGIYVGMAVTAVSGSGFPTGATVASVAGTTITISATTTSSGSGTLNFSSIITLSANAASAQASTTLNFSSILTLVNGTVNISGALNVNYSGTMSSFTTTGNTINLTGTKLCTISSPFSLNSLTIYAGDSLAIAASVTPVSSIVNNGVIQLNSGGSLSNSITYNNGSAVVFNQANYSLTGSTDYFWPATNPPTIVNALQALNLNSQSRTVAAASTFYAGAAITSATSLTVNGTLQLNAGGSLTGAPTLGSSSTLIYNTATSTTIGNEWNNPANVTINAGTTISMGTQAAAQTIAGNLLINGGFTLSTTASPNGDLIVNGNWTHANSGAIITFNNKTITFSGSTTSTILNSGSGTEIFYNLTVNKSSGGVSMSSPITISNQLTLTNGIITTNANQLLINNTSNTSVTGSYSASSFINGALSWKLPASSGSTYTFPIGNSSSYYPLSLASPTTSTSGTTIATAQIALSNCGGTADNTTVSAISGTEYWSLASAVGNITGGNLSLTRTGVAIAPYNLMAKSTSLSGTYSSIAGTASGNSINTSNSLTSISNGNTNYFVMGTYSTTPTITGITGGATSNTGYIGQTITINGANFQSGCTVSFNGGSANATTFISSTQIRLTIPANATTGNITATVGGVTTNGFAFSILGYSTTQSGDWSAAATWIGGVVPPSNAIVSISNTITISNANYAATVSSLTIGSGGRITFSNTDTLYTNSLVNNGTITMTAGGVVSLTGTNPSFTNTNTFTYGIGTVALNGTVSNTITGQNNFYNINVGGVASLCNDTLYGSLTVTGIGSYSCSPVGAGSLPSVGAGQTVNIYASPNGSGVGNGASFYLPVNLARARIIAQNYPNNPCNVLLEDGTYYQLTLNAADSRTASAPAIYKAINRGKAIFQPLKVINRSDFQPIPDSVKQRIIDPNAKGKVMQLNLATYNINAQSVTPWATVVSNTPKYPVFYQNTTPLMLSRYPNDTTMSMNGVIYKGTNKTDSGGIFNYSDTRTNKWVNAMNDEGVWLAGNWRVSFVIQYIKTKSIDTVNKIIYQKDGVQLGIGNKFAAYAGNYQEPYFVSNLFEEIDTVGEFSVNFNNKMLYMWVPDTGTIQYADSLTMPAISATGANYTQFQNINFIGGAGSAITVSSANNVRIAGCDITQCSDDAIILNDVTYTTVQSNDIHQVGSGGVAMFNNTYNTDVNTLKRGYDTVINNYFYDYAKQVPLYNAAIDLGQCIGVYVANNKVRKCPHIGLAYGFGAGDLSSMEYNEVDSVVLVYSDMGAIYGTGVWKDRGHKFNHNYLHDILGGNGLYLDNNTSGDTCVYNIVANSIWGMGNNGGNYNRFFNNIMINNARPVVSNFTADTIIDFVRNYPVVKNLWYSNPTWQSTFPELIDLVDSVNGVNKTYSSNYWSQMKNNAFFTFGPNFSGQTFTYVNDNSLFNADGTTNNAYAQTGDPFVRWGTVFQDNYKVYNKLKNPIYPFLMDSLRTPGLLTTAGATDWHINRIGLYTDAFRTDISSTSVKGIAPVINMMVNSTTNHIFPDTSIITATVVLPNAANCFSSVKFLDNGTVINGLTINKATISYDTVIYTATYTGAALGNHSITFQLNDAPNWQYLSNPFSFTTDTSLNWTGNVSTDWGTAANWSANRIPLASDIVVIPSAGITRMPTLATNGGYAKRLTVKSGATLTLNDTLVVSGNVQSSGTINGNSTLETSDTSTTALPSGMTWTVGVYYNSTFNQTIVSGNYNNLNISGGPRTLANTGTIGIAGNYTVTTGLLTTTGSTVNFIGSGTQTISGATTFNNLQLNKTGVTNPLTLGGATTVAGTLTLTSGRIYTTSTNSLTITNTSTAAVLGGNSTAYIDGPLTLTVVVGSNNYVFPVGDYTVSSAYLPDSITSITNAGNITITAFKANSGGSYNSSFTSISTNEYWSVQSSVSNTIGLTITPITLGSNNLIGQSATVSGQYVSIGGTTNATSIAATTISLTANTPAYFVAGAYPNPTITSVTSCLPGLTAGSFFARDTLTIIGNYFTNTTTVNIGGQAATILDVTGIPTRLKVLVSATASTGVVRVGNTVYNGTYNAGYVTRFDGKWNDGVANNPTINNSNYSIWLGGTQPTGSSYSATINNVVTMASSVSSIQSLTINAGAAFTTSNIGTSFNSGATLTNNGTYSSNNSNGYTNLTFVNNGKATLGGQNYSNINLTNNTGDSIIISAASVTMSGTVTNNGYFKHTATALYVSGSLTLNGTGVDTINSLTTNAGTSGTITFTTAPYLSGNFALNANYTVAGNYPIYSGNLYYNTGSTQTIGYEWKPNVSSGSGVPAAVLIGNGNANSSISLISGNNYKCSGALTISNGCSLSVPTSTTLQTNGLKAIGTLNINDGAIVQSGSTTTVYSTGIINIGDNALSNMAINGTNASLIVTSGNLNDTGVVNNNGYIKMGAADYKILSTGSLSMQANSVLECANNSPIIPAASWDASSYLFITGLTTGSPTNISQTFGNLLWNCTSQTGNLSITGLNSITKSFTLLNTGSGSVRLNNATNMYGSLQVGGSAVVNGVTVNATAASLNLGYTTAGATTVNGNVTIGTNGTLAAATAGTSLALSGNWSDAGTFTNTNTTISFNGSTATPQTIAKSGGETFNNLLINTSGAGGVSLNNAVTIANNLNLTSGILSLSNNNLTLNATATVSNASNSSYILTSGTGLLIKNTVNTTAFSFPLGTTTTYTPLTIANTSGTSNVSVAVSPTLTNAVGNASKMLNLQWTVIGSAATTATMTYQFNTANGAASFVATNACELGIYTNANSVSSVGTPSGSNPFTLNKTGIALASGATNLYVIGNTGSVNCTTGTYVGINNGDAASASNWCGGLPSSITNVIISANSPKLTTNLSVNNLTLSSGLNLNGNTLTVNGTISGAGMVTGSPSSNVVLAGSAAGTLYFDQTTTDTTNTINNLTINTSGTITLGNALHVKGTITPNSGTFNTGGNLTLLSDSNGTARIDQMAGTISGNVTVQRYIPAKASRKYSFLGCPVNSTIRNGWQQQVYITGVGTGGSVCGTTTGNGVNVTDKYNNKGFDVSPTNMASMFTYQASQVNGSRWVTIPNTDQTNFSRGIGYRINIRGNRNSATVNCNNQLNSANPTAPEAVTLSATGSVSSGNVVIALNDTAIHKYTLLANPYPSQISYTAFQAANPAINNKMWTYSPFGNSNYTTYSAGVIANGASGYDNVYGNYLAVGQAFFVEANRNGSVTFQEGHKVNGTIPNTKYFGAILNKMIRIGYQSATNSLLDEVVLRFNPQGTKEYNAMLDAASLNSGNQTLTINKDVTALAIATLPDSFKRDTARLAITSNVNGNYQLFFSDYAQLDSNISLVLRDKFLNITRDIRLNQTYPFNITADTLSQGKNRFEIILQKANTILPINFITLTAKEENNAVMINWNVANEQHINCYSIERSTDGFNFSQIANTSATNASNYLISVENPTTSTTYYRIKAIGENGTIMYSNTTQLITHNSSLITINPNPVQNSLNIYLANSSFKAYQLRILTIAGKEVVNRGEVLVNNSMITIPANNLAAGVYVLELMDVKGNKCIKKFVKE